MSTSIDRLFNGRPLPKFPVPDGFADMKGVEVFVDETGDRGWTSDSSPWFGMCAVMIPQESVPQMRATVRGLRAEIGTTKPLHWVEHFRKPAHEGRRDMASRMVAAIPDVKVVYVVADKATMVASEELRRNGALFYHWTMRLLLERVANALAEWDGGARRGVVKLGAVKGMDHGESVRYLANVRRQEHAWDTPWKFMAWPPKWVGTNEYDGVQVADLYLGMLRWAIERGSDDPNEARHVLRHWHQLRCSSRGGIMGYGVKVHGDTSFLTSRDWWVSTN
ncbi:DUF3800 domain-containing protein [Brachybacterium sp. UMB0905]|uniref:DUF3800 domain-containing protein n=1 Tax=Brachybacterium sp. UMB0905 TaxID=2069310 RepID=UPI000C7F8F68|nr:DUF3800 domain-containing protein [Brachybacterium sp. UMB0905]PMC76366.1 hypothetical protein CJ197_04215 [Brachybacterium sp. UMB0905]